MHEQCCAHGAVGVLPGDHLRPVPERWREPGATGVSRQVRAFTRYRLLEEEVVTASPFTPCFAPALLWSVAPFVHVGDAGGKCSLKRAEQVWTGGSTLICFTELVESPCFLPQSHAGRRFAVRNFILSLLKMNLLW